MVPEFSVPYVRIPHRLVAKDLPKLKAAIKKKDGWWASLFAGPLANRFLEPICDWAWVSPNLLTTCSLLIGLFAALCFALADHVSLIIGGVLVQLSFVVDCMDGQLARYRQQFSNFGAWYDRISDRLKDFMYFFALAWGCFTTEQDWRIWPLAMLAMFVVFLIDYYVNQDMKLEVSQSSEAKEKPKSKNLLGHFLAFGMQVYKHVPILRFNIGEQSLFISLFVFFNAVPELLLVFAVLGSFCALFWPIAKLKGFIVK